MILHECPTCGPRATRRAFLGGAAAALMPLQRVQAQAAQDRINGRIDVHYHVFPPETVAASRNPAQQSWTVARAIEELDRNGVATGIASAGSATPVDKARPFNEFAAFVKAESDKFLGIIKDANIKPE